MTEEWISNAIPHKPKSEKHPYENLVNMGLSGMWRDEVRRLYHNSSPVSSTIKTLKPSGFKVFSFSEAAGDRSV